MFVHCGKCLCSQKPQEHYVEEAETGPKYEQRQWEEEHLNAALLKFGAQDAKLKNKVIITFGHWVVNLFFRKIFVHIF